VYQIDMKFDRQLLPAT